MLSINFSVELLTYFQFEAIYCFVYEDYSVVGIFLVSTHCEINILQYVWRICKFTLPKWDRIPHSWICFRVVLESGCSQSQDVGQGTRGVQSWLWSSLSTWPHTLGTWSHDFPWSGWQRALFLPLQCMVYFLGQSIFSLAAIMRT